MTKSSILIDSAQTLAPAFYVCPSGGAKERHLSLANAGAIQQRLLPHEAPLVENAECSAVCLQADEVGGDFYDFLSLSDGRLGIVIGDVCGKGLGAALMMANLQATLRAVVRQMPDGLADSIALVNRLFHEASLEGFYSTLFYATFDPKTRILNYVNAGHFPPLVVRKDRYEVEWLGSGGAPVGLFPIYGYEPGSIALRPSDVMIAYTDGVIDNLNASGEEWGTERMVRLANAGKDRTAAELRTRITDAVHRFGGGQQHDDMTLVVLRVL